MKPKTKYFVLLMLLVTLSIITIILLNGKKEIKLDNVSLNKIDEYSGLAFLIEQTDGTYEKSENNGWPTEGYKLNQRLSGCVDNNGNTINKAVKYEYGTLKVKTRVNASCYLYFDRRKAATEELINTVSSEQLWDSTLEDDGYRYVGTNPDNYICFGTTDQEECINDTDKYMYRIIGIFEDEEGVQHLKLIKKEALNTAYAWNSDYSIDVDWGENDLYKGINGSYFATNENYSYMQDSAWNNIITTWNYTAVNTKAYENYVTNEIYGIHYGYNIVKTVYLHEMNKENNASKCYYNSSNEGDCSIGVWENVTSKIGLMYVSDYNLSLGSKAIEFDNYNSEHYTLMKTGWLYIGNSDNDSPSLHEWTMSKYGNSGSVYNAFSISVEGYIGRLGFTKVYSARPVFYLEENVELKEGYGTINEPYMISQETATEELLATVPEEQLWKSTLEDDGYRYVGTNPDNYICFGTTSQEECMNDTDKYMYRIIGIFEDVNGSQHLKLIKKEALNTAYQWYNMHTTDVAWDESDLYKGINESYFATNEDYSYMQDSAWHNLITTWNYTAVNTKAYENYVTNEIYGIHYGYNIVKTVYLHEMHKENNTSKCYYNSSNEGDCSIGVWENVTSKIGLMYVSDYNLSLGSKAIEFDNNNIEHYTLMKNGWMYISNNDIEAPSNWEWTMSKYGNSGLSYNAFSISSDGDVGRLDFEQEYSVRPVFYLESDTKLDKGTGTIDDPYTIEISPNLKEYCEEYNNINECIENEENNIEEVSDLWNSTLEEDGIRYVGTNPNNYVCFGTTNEEECTNDTDKYMYRIIGIFKDSDGKQHLKLIKKEALNPTYMWHSDYKTDTDWDVSDLFKGLNGISGGYYSNLFVGNSEYSYMSTSNNWYSKIIDWEYTATNTLSYEESGPDYGSSSLTIKNLYLHEMNRSTKTSTVGEWKTVPAKIGLIYVSDYKLSLGETTLNNTHYSLMKTGWLHISNNSLDSNINEWTMTRYGMGKTGHGAWYIDFEGSIDVPWVSNSFNIRPVFYLTENIKITSGKGSITEPFIIS